MKPESLNMTRRQLLQVAVIGTAAVTVAGLSQAKAVDAAFFDRDLDGHPDMIRVKSGPSRLAPGGHTHFLDIPGEWLDHPPAQGVKLKTTRTLLHTHSVTLSQAQLQAIAAGKVVTVEDSVGDHLYQISWKA